MVLIARMSRSDFGPVVYVSTELMNLTHRIVLLRRHTYFWS